MVFSKMNRTVRGAVAFGLAAMLAVPSLAYADEEGTEGEPEVKDPTIRAAFTQNGSHIGWNGYVHMGLTDEESGETGDPFDVNVEGTAEGGKWYSMAGNTDGTSRWSGDYAAGDMGSVLKVADDGATVLSDRVFYENLNRNAPYHVIGTIHLRQLVGVEFTSDGGTNAAKAEFKDMGTLLGIHDGVVEFADENGHVFEAPMVWDGKTAPTDTGRTVEAGELGIWDGAVTGMASFAPRTESGYVDVTFDDLDCTGLYGWTLVAYEHLVQAGENGFVPDGESAFAAAGQAAWPEDEPTREMGVNQKLPVGSIVWYNDLVPAKVIEAVSEGDEAEPKAESAEPTENVYTIERYDGNVFPGDTATIDGVAYTVTSVVVGEDGKIMVTLTPDDPQGTGAEAITIAEDEMSDEMKSALEAGTNRVKQNFLATYVPNVDDEMAVVPNGGLNLIAAHNEIWDPNQAVSFTSVAQAKADEPIIDEIVQKEEEKKEVEQKQAEETEKFVKEVLPKTGVAAVILAALAACGGIGFAIYRRMNGKLAYEAPSNGLSGRFKG